MQTLRISSEAVLREVTKHYLDSRDFNGITALNLAHTLGVEWEDLHGQLTELIEQDLIGVLYSDDDVNTHILRLGFPTPGDQISKLKTDELYHTCIYPRPSHLSKVVDISSYRDEPYKLCLALGEPQLSYRSFDLSVLEFYRNDPRYLYSNDDINGFISVSSEYDQSDKMPERDKILVETFGFSYDEELNRAVAVYLRYLADLSPEHQQIWKAKELTGDYQLHPDYYRNTIIGDWGEKVPIFSAFVNELYIINEMAKAMGRPPLFRQDYGEYGEGRPQKFSFLVRPTLEEFNNFVLLLDKLLSDNINKEFFQNEVSYETEIEREDGRIQVQPKGTLQILDNWIRRYFRTTDWTPWDESIKVLREVRKLRQKPAHALNENLFDQHYFKEQRELIIKAYSAIRTLRLLLANHRLVRDAQISIPDWLERGDIWTI
jgi:hypothetical protein